MYTGNPIWERQKREAEIAATNWTKLADEWLKEREKASENFDIALLPFNNRFRKLPPTADTIIINKTNTDQLERVRNRSLLIFFPNNSKRDRYIGRYISIYLSSE